MTTKLKISPCYVVSQALIYLVYAYYIIIVTVIGEFQHPVFYHESIFHFVLFFFLLILLCSCTSVSQVLHTRTVTDTEKMRPDMNILKTESKTLKKIFVFRNFSLQKFLQQS